MSDGLCFFLGLLAGTAASAAVAVWLLVLYRRRLLAMARQAREAERLAELGTLTGGLAHEIKNPLSTVQLNLALLREDITARPDAEQRVVSRLKTVESEAARLRDILDDFLRYAGRMTVEPQPLELNETVEELVDFFAPQAQQQKVRLRFQPSPQPLAGRLDPTLIKQALLNLMLNATQAMPQGGELMLRVTQARLEGRPAGCIEVIDTGAGIKPEDRQRIFDAYYSRRRGGTGLGLAMTRRIAQEHGGTLTVDSQPGQGSCFSMTLPLGDEGKA